MKITFRSDVSLEATMVFEACYEPELAMKLADKAELRDTGWVAIWIFVDGRLAGETYGIRLENLDEEIEDCAAQDPAAIYCYSTTILPEFQGKGLSKIIKAFWLGMVHPAVVVGHATAPAIRRIVEEFGAEILATHQSWYGTGREAAFYRIAP